MRAVGEPGICLRAWCRQRRRHRSRRHWKHWRRQSHRCRCRRRRSWRCRTVARPRWARADRGGRGHGVDRPGGRGRGRVDVSGLVDCADLEGMRAVGKARVGLRASCRPRRRHRRLAPALEVGATPEPPVSVPEKAKLALELFFEPQMGPSRSRWSGRCCRPSRLILAGVASTFPAWSIALTSKLCEPSASPE